MVRNIIQAHIKPVRECCIYLEQNVKKNKPIRRWDLQEQRDFLDIVFKRLRLQTHTDWYHVTTREICKQTGGRSILELYGNSLISAVQILYPEHIWKISLSKKRIDTKPRGYWKDLKNQRQFIDDLAVHLNVTSLPDWYMKASNEVVMKYGGHGLLNIYNGSFYEALKENFKDFKWEWWKFRKVPSKLWDKDENVLEVLDWVSNHLNIEHLSDWYDVTANQLKSLGCTTLLQHNGGIFGTLSKYYPDYNWDMNRFHQSPLKVQSVLHRFIFELFPGRR